jgi:hypothetical protein
MKKFKEKLTKQLFASYGLMILSDILMAVLYMFVYNSLLSNIFSSLQSINILQSYLIFYCVRLIFNRTNNALNVEEEIFDSFKRNILKFMHYMAWGIFIKLLFVYY